MRISDWSSDVCSSDLITFDVGESPRTYVERIDVNGNTLTQDKVVRREFRLNEGDAFNSFAVKRTESRINSLGYFQENLEVERKEGSAPDRIILETNVQEKPTGELSLSAGFSSIESFLVQRSEEHTSELQSLMRISYAVFCLKKKNKKIS